MVVHVSSPVLGTPVQTSQQWRGTSPVLPHESLTRSPAVSCHPAVVQEEDFELPPPVVGLEEEPASGSLARPSQQSDSEASDFDYEEIDMAKDGRMVRSPCGTRWVHVSKQFSLDRPYSIWFESGQNIKRKGRSEQQYEENLESVGSFNSIQEFWRYWNAMDLQRMPNFCSLSVFKDPIKPMWEDPGNKGGGRWVIRCEDKEQAVEYFERLALSLIGGYFECHEQLCGVVMGTKPKLYTLSLWNRKVDRELFVAVDYELRDLLHLPDHIAVEYKDHSGAIVTNQRQQNDVPQAEPEELDLLKLPPAEMAEIARPIEHFTLPETEDAAVSSGVRESQTPEERQAEAVTSQSVYTYTGGHMSYTYGRYNGYGVTGTGGYQHAFQGAMYEGGYTSYGTTYYYPAEYQQEGYYVPQQGQQAVWT